MRKLDKHYVSEVDGFFEEFDKRHPRKSESQQQEIQKHGQISKLRDKAQVEDEAGNLWD